MTASPHRASGTVAGGTPLEDKDGLSGRALAFAVFATLSALMMALLDSSIVNVALPTIARSLRVSDGQSIWVVNAYQLAVIVALLPLASLGEIVGFRRVHATGLVLFTMASIACALSPTLTHLSIARAAQGLGAAAMMSVNVALIRLIFPFDKLGRGIALMAMVGSVSIAIGPTLASFILSVASWPWLFAVNAPVGVIALWMTKLYIPPSIRSSAPFDYRSAGLCALTFGLFITGVDSFAHGGSARTAAFLLILAGLACALLVRLQSRSRTPLFPIDLLKIPLFSLSVTGAVCCFIAQGLAFVAIPFQLHHVLGLDQVATGLLMTPWPVAVVAVSPLAGWLSDRFPSSLIGGIGLLFMALGLFLISQLHPHSASVTVACWTSMCGIGFGLFNAPNNRAIVTSAPTARSGAASGMLATARLFGQTLGAALVALCFEIDARGWENALYLGAAFALCAGGASMSRRFTAAE